MAHVRKRVTPIGPRYDVRYTDPAGRERSKSYPRKALADAERARLTVQVGDGDWIDPDLAKIHLDVYARMWLAGRVDLSANTRHSYGRVVEGWLIPRWGGHPLHAIGHEPVAAWLASIADPDRGGRSSSWARTVRQVFGQIMDAAVRAQRIRSNPVRGAKLQRPPATTRHIYLTHEQVRAIAEAMGERWAPVVYVLAYVGLRWSELAGLRVGDVDLLHRRFHVRHAVTTVAGRLHFDEPKGHKRRTLDYPQLVHDRVKAGASGRPASAPLFPSAAGGWMRSRMFQEPLDRACAAAGLPRVTPHIFRHTCASLSVSAGANVKVVQQLLGHKSAVYTLDTYADLFPDDLSAVMARLDAAAGKVRRRDPDGIRPALGSV